MHGVDVGTFPARWLGGGGSLHDRSLEELCQLMQRMRGGMTPIQLARARRAIRNQVERVVEAPMESLTTTTMEKVSASMYIQYLAKTYPSCASMLEDALRGRNCHVYGRRLYSRRHTYKEKRKEDKKKK